MNLDHLDLRTALRAVEFWRSAHRIARMPVPPAADRLADNLTALLASKRQEDVAPQAKWLTTAEVADRMGCSLSTALRIARRVGHRVGRQWLTPDTALPLED